MTEEEAKNFNFAFDSLFAIHPNSDLIGHAIYYFHLLHPAGPTTRAIRLDLANSWLQARAAGSIQRRLMP